MTGHLAFSTAPSSAVAGQYSSAFEVQLQDQYGNPVINSGSDITVSLSASQGGWCSDTSGTPISTVTIANGASTSSDFYYMGIIAGSVTLGAADGVDADASGSIQVIPGAAALIVWSAPSYAAAGQPVDKP